MHYFSLNLNLNLRNQPLSFQIYICKFYQNLLVTISSNVEDNSFKLEAQDAIVNSLESTYNNLTKVDSDEEMINLLQYQAAYEANAKIITAVDEMLQTLLDM